jgi:hypothetical protein
MNQKKRIKMGVTWFTHQLCYHKSAINLPFVLVKSSCSIML